eukprot:TRINITY_DN7133_c0_g2_i1.p1 TRINITY_DN7133_c0_g2~~TRINITY_DN7133_c0_g2_i1.p1  ORF type:complete len:898 (-),score=165.36 TRINITY_DN7133_c0_g2_i1:286-2979(-)
MLGLLACVLYTMEGCDINELMFFDKSQPPDDSAQVHQWQDTNTVFGFRPTLRKEVKGNQAMYVEANWASRVLAQAMDLEVTRVLTPQEAQVKHLAKESLRSWIKCYCTLASITAAPLKKSYHKSTETVARGVQRLSQDDMDKNCGADNEGSTLGWTSVSSTSASPNAAGNFAGQGNSVFFTLDKVGIGTYMKPLSAYPHEEEILVPSLLQFHFNGKSRSGSSAKVSLSLMDGLMNSIPVFREFRERVMKDCCDADARLKAVRDLIEPKAASRELILKAEGDIQTLMGQEFWNLQQELLKAVEAKHGTDIDINVIPGSIVAMFKYQCPIREEYRDRDGGDPRARQEVDRCFDTMLAFGRADQEGFVPADSKLRSVGRWMKDVISVRAANPIIPTGNSKVDFELKQMYEAVVATGLPPVEAAKAKEIPFVDLDFIPSDAQLPTKPYTAKHDCSGKSQEIEVFGECKLDEHVMWERCTLLHPAAVVFGKDVGAQDINQGRLGDCWFMSALSILAEDASLVYSLLPAQGQDLSAGCLEFRCCKGGWWTHIVMDTYLPTSKGHGGPIYGHGRWIEEEKKEAGSCIARGATKEQWVSFVEKGYAKMCGGYHSIVGGDAAHAFTDLTGAASQTVEITEGLFEQVLKWQQDGYLLACSTPDDRTEELKAIGLASKHSYGILDVCFKAKKHKLLKVRNPWGCFEWKGGLGGDAESDAQVYKELGFQHKRGDGVFWICWHDICKFMTHITVCYRQRGARDVRVRWSDQQPVVLALWLQGTGTVRVTAHQDKEKAAMAMPILLQKKNEQEHEIVAGKDAHYSNARDVSNAVADFTPSPRSPCLATVHFVRGSTAACVLSVSTTCSVEKYEVWSGGDWIKAISSSSVSTVRSPTGLATALNLEVQDNST